MSSKRGTLQCFFACAVVGAAFILGSEQGSAEVFGEGADLLNPKVSLKLPPIKKEENKLLEFSFSERLLKKEKEPAKVPVSKPKPKEETPPQQPPSPPAPPAPLTGPYSEGNTYAEGHCTYYVKSYFKTRVGDHWGNAVQWVECAAADGLLVDKNPVAESTVAVFGASPENMGYGHVAVVIGVGNGVVTIREMNYGGLWNMHEREVPISSFLGFIHV